MFGRIECIHMGLSFCTVQVQTLLQCVLYTIVHRRACPVHSCIPQNLFQPHTHMQLPEELSNVEHVDLCCSCSYSSVQKVSADMWQILCVKSWHASVAAVRAQEGCILCYMCHPKHRNPPCIQRVFTDGQSDTATFKPALIKASL